MSNTFSKLHPEVQDALSIMGFNDPTEPQVRTIPNLIKKKNMLLIAPTGSGKTESAILPIFHHILELNENNNLGGPVICGQGDGSPLPSQAGPGSGDLPDRDE